MPNYPYLSRSGKRGFWRYRRSVPTHLRTLIGVREVLMSFNTTVREEALPQYHFVAAETERQLDLAQAEWDWREQEKAAHADGGDTIINELVPQLLDGEDVWPVVQACDHVSPVDACVRHYQQCKEGELAFRYETTKRVTADPAAFWRGDIIQLPMSQDEFYALPQFAHLAGTGDGYKYLLATAYAKRLEDRALVLKTMLVTLDVEAVAANFGSCTKCARQLGLTLVDAELRLIKDLLATDAALLPIPAAPTLPTASGIQSTQRPSCGARLSYAVEQWIKSGSQGRSAWSAERRALCQRVMSEFIEICGDKGVGEYRKSDGREFVQLLRRLPANLEKRKASLGLEGKGLRKIADMAEHKGLTPQDDSNTNKKVGIVNQCFGWITTRFDECIASPADGMKIALRRSAKEEKDPFTIEQLNAIFAAPVFVGCLSERHWNRPGQVVLRQSAKFWVPLIALFSGMRSGEICQLAIRHVRQHDGVHYFAVTNDLRLKNPTSVRSVPIHDTLVKCGFLEFLATREGPLFPELTQHASGRWSDAFGKHFARFMKSIGAHSESTDFHSFRHAFVAAADACGIDFATRERIIGHALQGQAGRYGKNYKQEQADMQLLLTRNRQLQTLRVPGLELKHLQK